MKAYLWIALYIAVTCAACGDDLRADDECCLLAKDAQIQTCLDTKFRDRLSDPSECGFWTCEDSSGKDHNFMVCPLESPP